MGRETRNFRQSAKSQSGNMGARNYGQQNRGFWHSKVLNFMKIRGKRGNNGQS